MKLTFGIIFFLNVVTSNGQTIPFNENPIDTIQIASHLGSFHFDKKGTTTGKTEFIEITFSTDKKNYIISSHIKSNYKYTFSPLSHNIKTKRIKKDIETTVNDSLLTQLLTSLKGSENPKKTFNNFSQKSMNSYVNRETILKIAKWLNVDWYFKMDNSTKEKNELFFLKCQSIDTFNIYLAERYDTTGYTTVTDYWNTINIRIVTSEFQYVFEGKYPNPSKQPWYIEMDSINIYPKNILNLNINRSLELVLPKNFLLKSTISEAALMNDYIVWYLERREIKK